MQQHELSALRQQLQALKASALANLSPGASPRSAAKGPHAPPAVPPPGGAPGAAGVTGPRAAPLQQGQGQQEQPGQARGKEATAAGGGAAAGGEVAGAAATPTKSSPPQQSGGYPGGGTGLSPGPGLMPPASAHGTPQGPHQQALPAGGGAWAGPEAAAAAAAAGMTPGAEAEVGRLCRRREELLGTGVYHPGDALIDRIEQRLAQLRGGGG